MTQEEHHRRLGDFPGPVRVLGNDCPRVRRIMEMYAHGGIITLQEALCQMVVELAADTESQRKQMIDLMQRQTFVPMMTAFDTPDL